MLPDLKPRCDGEGMRVGRMTYRTVIVPDMETIRGTTLDALEDFVGEGGRVIFAGEVPWMVDLEPSERARRLAQGREAVAGSEALVRALADGAWLRVTGADGARAHNLLHRRRGDGEVEWLFLCHAFPRRERVALREDYTLRVPGRYAVERLDALTGEIHTMPVRREADHTLIPWSAHAEDSLLLRLTPGEGALGAEPEPDYVLCETLPRPAKVTLSESGDYTVGVPLFAAALLSVRLDGRDVGRIAFAPHRLSLGRMDAGHHALEIDAYVGRHNGFGPLHNSNDAFHWFGPDAWRTSGDEWTDDYRLLPVGLLSGVELFKRD